MGGDKSAAGNAARAVMRSHRKRIGRFVEMGYLDIWYDRIDERAQMDRR